MSAASDAARRGARHAARGAAQSAAESAAQRAAQSAAHGNAEGATHSASGGAAITVESSAPPAQAAAELAARHAYGRLVAWLAYRWRDLAAAEDALSAAFVAALERWPRSGVPDAPEAWLLTVAKRELLQRERHARVERAPEVLALFDEEAAAPTAPAIPDERLKLMFVCAHPALPAAVHAPLMLQAVLGLEAATIAEAFLVSPSAMAQRLVRAKAKIRDTGLRFEEPEASELPERLVAVLDSIYGAYTLGVHRSGPDADADAAGVLPALSAEALYLARLVVALLPSSAEALGLLALLLYCEARRPARFDATGRFVPLTEQDTSLWQRPLMGEAEALLRHASQLRAPGSFQLEAAIQSAHCQRAFTGQTPWRAISQLYGLMVAHYPSVGARIGQAVAQAEAGEPAQALAALQAIPTSELRSHAPYWVALAHLLRRTGHHDEADTALERAIGLTADERLREYLGGTRHRAEG